MKKYFILAAAALVTLASCVKNNADTTAYEQGRQINFSTVTGKATKAPITNNYFHHNSGSFGVYALYLDETQTWASDFASSAFYMGAASNPGVEISFDNTLNIWKSTANYYWPLQGSLTFFGYYPSNLASPVYALATKQFSIGSFSVDETVSAQKEVLVSSFAVEQTHNSTVYNDGELNSGSEKGVNIVFNHMLSQVVFTAAAASDVVTSGLSFKINSIKVAARKTSAGMTVVPGGTPSWTAPTALTVFNVRTSDFPNATEDTTPANYLTTSQSTAIGDALLMIPVANFNGANGSDDADDANTNDDEYIDVEYTLYRINPTLDMGTKTVRLYLNANGDAITSKWEPGKKYTYQLTIGLEKIYFAPTVSDWDDPNNQPVTVPGNGTTV